MHERALFDVEITVDHLSPIDAPQPCLCTYPSFHFLHLAPWFIATSSVRPLSLAQHLSEEHSRNATCICGGQSGFNVNARLTDR